MSCGTILWDFDGTLVDRPLTWSGSLLSAFDELWRGHSVKLEEIRVHTAKNFPWHEPEKDYLHLRDPQAWWHVREKMLLDVVTSFGPGGDHADAIVRATKRNILDPSLYKTFPDVVPTLTKLRERGWRQMILSNNYPELEAVVQGMGLGGHFSRIFTSALIGYEKPRREIYEVVLSEIGHSPTIWMIGDSEKADAFGAENAGIRAILVRKKPERFHRAAQDLQAVMKILEVES